MLKAGECVEGAMMAAVRPTVRMIRSTLDFATAWASSTGPDMESLKPVKPQNGVLLGEWWK